MSDGTRTYTWQHGRQMATVTKDGVTWTNTYNADGLRIKRASSTTTYTYVYNGSQLTQMTVGDNTLRFTYDAAGSPMLVTYNGTNYYYVTNLQGDVVAIVDANGNPVVRYEYDPWGALLSCAGSMANTLGVHNPLLYRAYVYDPETDLYYLQSRYYDPSLRRFLNADGLASTGQGIIGNNMFVYCLNNPTNCADSSGTRCVAVSALREGDAVSFATQEEAAMDFYINYLYQSLHIRHEVATEIYAKTTNGRTRYYYNYPHFGNPHDVVVPYPIPSGTRLVAVAHTHINNDDFSSEDVDWAGAFGVLLYMAGPGRMINRYNYQGSDGFEPIKIPWVSLTEEEKRNLETLFSASWERHINSGVDECGNKRWPIW